MTAPGLSTENQKLSRETIKERIQEAKAAVGGSVLENLKGGVYKFMDTASRTYLAAQKGGAEAIASLKDTKGNPLWSVDEVAEIAGTFLQLGGAEPAGAADKGITTAVDKGITTAVDKGITTAVDKGTTTAVDKGTTTAAKPKYQTTPTVQPAQPLDPQSVSLDRAYHSIQDYLKQLDERNRALSQELGPIALIKDRTTDYMIGPFPPYMPVALPVSPRLVLPIINTFLETLRLLATFGPLESDFLRMLFSAATAVLEVARGEWRNGVLSALGVFGPWYVYAGTIGKVFRLVYGFVAPDIQDALEENMFMAAKSLLVGPWLWLFSLTAPAFIRDQMTKLTDTLKKQVDNFNGIVTDLESAAQAKAAPLGLRLDFNRLDPALVPSFDDIQQIQRLLRAPEVQCLDATQAALAPLAKQAAFRVILELLGIVVDPALLEKKCRGQPRTLKNVLESAASYSITAQKGGKRTTRRRAKKQSL
jgi:hypothetical protein